MNAEEIKKLIPLYLEKELEPNEYQLVKDALAQDSELRQYAQELQSAWDSLGDLDPIKPSPNFVSNFWTELSAQDTSVNIFGRIRQYLYNRRVAPVFAGICGILLLSIVVLKGPLLGGNTDIREFSQLSIDDIEILENIELVENLEIIEDIEFLEDLDVINEMEDLELSYAT